MRPGEFPLDLYRGDTYQWRFRLWEDEDKTIPADLTGATAAAQIRDRPGGEWVMEIATTVELPQYINATLHADEWGEWCRRSGTWDLEVTFPGNVVQTVLVGPVSITIDVTEPIPAP